MRRLIFALTLLAATGTASFAAQAPQPSAPTLVPPSAQAPRPGAAPGPTTTPQATAPAAPSRPPSLSGPTLNGVNIRLDITITDTFDNTPQKKTVSMTILSGQTGMVRTQNTVGPGYPVRLNVDAMAAAYSNGLVSARLTVNYLPAPRLSDSGKTTAERAPTPGQLEESIAVVLTDGKPLVLTESADPVSDRKVTLEAKATILK